MRSGATAKARAQGSDRRRRGAKQSTQSAAATNAIAMSPDPSAPALMSGAASGAAPAATLSNPIGTAVAPMILTTGTIRQVPAGMTISQGFTGGTSDHSISVVDAGSSSAGTGTTGMGAGSTSMTGSSASMTGTSTMMGMTTSMTTSATIGTPTPLTFSPLPFSPLTFTPTTTTMTPANPSPIPTNGVLPSTGTPANPSPVPLNGVLPSTGTPANPSPVPLNGGLF